MVDPHHPGDREGRVSAFTKAVPPFAPTEAVISPSLRLSVSARGGEGNHVLLCAHRRKEMPNSMVAGEREGRGG